MAAVLKILNFWLYLACAFIHDPNEAAETLNTAKIRENMDPPIINIIIGENSLIFAKKLKRLVPTAPRVPRQSPIQVL